MGNLWQHNSKSRHSAPQRAQPSSFCVNNVNDNFWHSGMTEALRSLANRKGKDRWCTAIANTVVCMLCDQTIWISTRDNTLADGDKAVKDHGLQHLKEHNLLAMI